MPDSDSDRTVDSDELQAIISSKQQKFLPGTKTGNKITKTGKEPALPKGLHDISDSGSDDGDRDLFPSDGSEDDAQSIELPRCKYWEKCYRKNPEHLKMFAHPGKGPVSDSSVAKKRKLLLDRTKGKGSMSPSQSKLPRRSQSPQGSRSRSRSPSSTGHSNSPRRSKSPAATKSIFGFYVTKVSGIPEKFNSGICYDIKDILSANKGKLKASAQFNFKIDIPWLMEQYPKEARHCPLTIVHGAQREEKRELEKSGEGYPNIKFCKAKLDIPFGTHHTKMMILLYEDGLRVVIHTSNLVHGDWHQKTQGMWISPIFPPLRTSSSASAGDSVTGFKTDLLDYISSYGAKELDEWCSVIKKHDMYEAKVFVIGSVPGRHTNCRKSAFGHLKLRKVLSTKGPPRDEVGNDWYVIGQFSSIGSLGATPDQWLCSEFMTSLSTLKESSVPSAMPSLKLVFPTVENVRHSLEGYPAGGSLPYSFSVAKKQPYLKNYLHQWKSERLHRSEASPHIKTYMRLSSDDKKMAWFLVTSANLSKAAWGSLEKKGSQFMIRSYELGVLFLPQYFGQGSFFSVPKSKQDSASFMVPYDIPLTKYGNKDQPWIWDIPHMHAPDRFGNMWCPP